MDYDVIVAGASFAGISVAREIRGDILLIDRKEIGSMPTSACGTFLKTLQENQAMDSLRQVIPWVKFFTTTSRTEFRAPHPFCTFDYRSFCHILARGYKGDFLLAKIVSVEENTVITDQGNFSARCLVDCTGGRAVLATSVDPDFAQGRAPGFAIETEIEGLADDALHFFIDPTIIEEGLAWIFPAGKKSRFGLGSYAGRKQLIPELERFVGRYGLELGSVHGGHLPCGLRKAAVGRVFLVGDSAGQVLPVSGEGIRQAIFFGKKCSSLVQQVINEEMRLETALALYDAFVQRYKAVYDFLMLVQGWLVRPPNKRVEILARVLGPSPVARLLQARYARFM